MRTGGPSDMQVERFIEAVHDRNTQLSYHALAGTRKQSVSDVEQIFSSSMISFMERNGYTFEAKYISVVRNWRRACDERGLSQNQRSRYNKQFLDYILEELMPWYSKPGMKDFLLLEVNQPINNIRGFTRETLSALLANIESREFRRMFANEHGIQQEHPRASTTDDVECFFSVLRDMVGKDFTHNQVMFGWRKVCEEFVKRMDPDLPFYYYTSNYQRFYEGDMPDFTVPAAKPREEPQPARRELLGGMLEGVFQ